MKALSLAVAASLLLVAPLFAANPVDNSKLVQELERTSAKFLASVEGLSEAQWNFKAAPDKWSIAEVAEHIAAAEPFIRGAITKSLEKPAAKSVLKKGASKDELVSTMIVDRSRKFNAPEPLAPQNRFGSGPAAVEEFKKQRAETIALASSGKDFRKYATEHPGFGMLDAYGWILFLSGHSERHTLQIEEIQSMDAYPVK